MGRASAGSQRQGGQRPRRLVLSADPVALLLVGLGRISRWSAVAPGLISAAGGLSPRPSDGSLAGRIVSVRWIADASVTPVVGDCAVTPVSRIHARGVFTAR